MNGRAIYRRIRRKQKETMWGRRAMLTVRLPASIFSVPPPKQPVSHRVLSNGKLVVQDIHLVTCGSDPRLDKDRSREPYFVTETILGGEPDFKWYEGTEYTYRNEDEMVPVSERVMTEDEVRPFAEFNQWANRFLYEYGHNDVYDAFLDARTWAATHYYDFIGGSYIMTYSVKPYPSTLKRFSSELARALRTAKAAGVAVRVFK